MTLALAQLFHLGALAAVAMVLALQLVAVYVSPLARLLDVTPLAPTDWPPILMLAAVPALFGQLMKLRAARRAPAA